MQLEQVDRRRRVELDQGDDLLALERTVAVEREPGLHLGSPFEQQPGGDDERERGRDDDELCPAERERRDQADGREPEVRREPGRRERGHAGGAGAGGATSSAGRRRHQLERLAHDVLTRSPLHPQLGLQERADARGPAPRSP